MPDIRSLIRDVLAEEIATIRLELLGGAGIREERVRVDDARALTDFAVSLLHRSSDPGFVSALQGGSLIFVPTGAPTTAPAGPDMPMAAYAPGSPSGSVFRPVAPNIPQQPTVLVTTMPSVAPEITKGLISERDIAGLGSGTARLRIGKQSRLTPLAADEVRRRMIRIERSAI